jgi:hypothetical protein
VRPDDADTADLVSGNARRRYEKSISRISLGETRCRPFPSSSTRAFAAVVMVTGAEDRRLGAVPPDRAFG